MKTYREQIKECEYDYYTSQDDYEVVENLLTMDDVKYVIDKIENDVSEILYVIEDLEGELREFDIEEVRYKLKQLKDMLY